MYFVYESHLGGYYITEEAYTHEDLYCDQCCDIDWYVGMFETLEEAEKFVYINESHSPDGYVID